MLKVALFPPLNVFEFGRGILGELFTEYVKGCLYKLFIVLGIALVKEFRVDVGMSLQELCEKRRTRNADRLYFAVVLVEFL